MCLGEVGHVLRTETKRVSVDSVAGSVLEDGWSLVKKHKTSKTKIILTLKWREERSET